MRSLAVVLGIVASHGLAGAQPADPGQPPATEPPPVVPPQPAAEPLPPAATLPAPPPADPWAPAPTPQPQSFTPYEPSEAPPPQDSVRREGFFLGGGLGFSGCTDKICDSSDSADADGSLGPGPGIRIEAAWRVNPIVAVGGLFHYNSLSVEQPDTPEGYYYYEESSSDDVTASFAQLGPFVRLYFLTDGDWDAWAGASAGTVSLDLAQGPATISVKGVYLEPALGVEYRVDHEGLAIGGAVQYALVNMNEVCFEAEGDEVCVKDVSEEIEDEPDFYGLMATLRYAF